MLETILLFAFGLNMATTEPSVQQSFNLPYIQAIYVPEPVKLYTDVPKVYASSCVDSAKWMIYGKIEGIWGNAKNIQPEPFLRPKRGILVKTSEGGGHIGVISSVSAEFLHVKECNYIPGKCTERELARNSDVIEGYLYPPLPKLK